MTRKDATLSGEAVAIVGFINNTSWSALDVPFVDPAGHEIVIAIVKATLLVRPDGRLVAADEQTPLRLNDVPWDAENPRSSLRYPTDVCPTKCGTDVVVIGAAVSRTPVTSVDVAVKVRDQVAPLVVHGERFYYRSAVRLLIGPAATFTHKPIVYERAFGGASDDWSIVEAQNPAGVGIAKCAADLDGTPAPQIEHPARPHKSAGDKHPPMGFGAIMSHWSPRKDHAGTFDDAWRERRMPLLPLDFDARFWNVAHPTLLFAEPLVAGDVIAIMGMTLDPPLRFELADLKVAIRARSDESRAQTVRPVIDTVIVEPTTRRVELTMRHAFRVGRGRDVLRELVVDGA